jgi:hypothetical protein
LRLVKPASNFARGKIEAADRRLKWWALRGLVSLLLAVPIGLGVSLVDPTAGVGAGVLVGAAGLIMIAIGFSYWTRESDTRKGWAGEVSVATELSYLNDQFLLLNDVMLPGSRGNIDHIVIGPTGVFVLETKNYSGKYVCYGDKWFFQGKGRKYDIDSVSLQAKNNATLLSNLLHGSGFTVEAQPVVIFANPSARLWLHHQTVPILRSGMICNHVWNQRPSFSLTGPYAEKVANRILMSETRAVPIYQPVSA